MRTKLTRRVSFHARHRMFLPRLGEAESKKRFGWTAEAPGHGHLYRVAVSIIGVTDQETGMLLDLAALDTLLKVEVVERYDGKDLNTVLTKVATGDHLPTCEVIAAEIWKRLSDTLAPELALHSVSVAEDDSLEAECLG